ncbi:MAG TPA: N-acetyltransferase [Candidatus Dormibacteraeota bacterium]|nr:N-acetyltransferase [Candidatus Dormibacteraeota bacterium]
MSAVSAVPIRCLQNEEEAKLCARAMASSEPWLTLGSNYEHCLKAITDASRKAYVAVTTDPNQVSGLLVLNLIGPLRGYVQMICVLPEFRNQGIGRQLLAFAERRIFCDYQNVFLCVSSFNLSAQRLYERLGYTRVGKLDNYVVQGHDEILMRKTIGPMKP